MEGPPLGEDTPEDAAESRHHQAPVNRCACWSRAKIFMHIIKRYEMLITYISHQMNHLNKLFSTLEEGNGSSDSQD